MKIGSVTVAPGQRTVVHLPVTQIYSHDSPLSLPVHIVRGKKDGPVMFVSAVVHGDELNGVISHADLFGFQGGGILGLMGLADLADLVGPFATRRIGIHTQFLDLLAVLVPLFHIFVFKLHARLRRPGAPARPSE